MMTNLIEATVWHHFPVRGVVITAPGLFVKLELNVEFATSGFEYAHALGNDFLADAVTGDDGDVVFGQVALRVC